MNLQADIDKNVKLDEIDSDKERILHYINEYDSFLCKVSDNVNRSCRKLEMQDIKQQIILALFSSAKHYDENLGASLNTYLSQIVINAGKNIVRAYWQDKNRANAECVSLDDYMRNSDGDSSYISFVCEDESNFLSPTNIYQEKETFYRVKEIVESLPDFERNVFELYISGMAINDISKKLGKPTKLIYNTIFKIRNIISRKID